MEITDILTTKFKLEKPVVLIFDEAQGIPAKNWDAAKGMLIGQDAAWITIQAPINPAPAKLNGNLNVGEAFEAIENQLEETLSDLNRLKKYFKKQEMVPKILDSMGEINPNREDLDELTAEDLQLLT